MHIEPDHTGKEDVHQPGGGDGRGRAARVGLEDHGERDVRHGGLVEGGGGERGATDDCQAVRRGDGGLLIGAGEETVRKDVNSLISYWEQLNAGGGGGGMGLQVPTGREGRRKGDRVRGLDIFVESLIRRREEGWILMSVGCQGGTPAGI